MPSNHTTNYQLSQWSKTDRVLMSEFNADNAKIDAALKAHDTALASKASTSALNSLKSTVAQHTASLAGKGNCIIAVSSYTGTGEDSKTLTFSRPPQLVIVGGGNGVIVLPRGATSVPGLCGGFYLNGVTWSGNSVTWSHGGSGGAGGAMNGSGSTYYVAALLQAD